MPSTGVGPLRDQSLLRSDARHNAWQTLGNVESGLVEVVAGLRVSIVSGGILCIAGAAAVLLALPTFRNSDADATKRPDHPKRSPPAPTVALAQGHIPGVLGTRQAALPPVWSQVIRRQSPTGSLPGRGRQRVWRDLPAEIALCARKHHGAKESEGQIPDGLHGVRVALGVRRRPIARQLSGLRNQSDRLLPLGRRRLEVRTIVPFGTPRRRRDGWCSVRPF
jgi:hypothetical protein